MKLAHPYRPMRLRSMSTNYMQRFFKDSFDLDTVGLRYFNVFGRKQDPNGAYAAVIPKFVIQLINHESPVINGDGSYSRDFTYIDNVIVMNLLALSTDNKLAFKPNI